MSTPGSSFFPLLITERLTLRKLSIEDQKDILALRSDPVINMYLGRQPAITIEDAADFIHKVNENIEKNIALYWAITLTETKTFVGTICLYNFSREENSCETGYELMTEFQGQGIMKEAAAVVFDFAFQTLKFNKILAFTHKDNSNSTRLLAKFGFVKSDEPDKDNPDLYCFCFQNS